MRSLTWRMLSSLRSPGRWLTKVRKGLPWTRGFVGEGLDPQCFRTNCVYVCMRVRPQWGGSTQ